MRQVLYLKTIIILYRNDLSCIGLGEFLWRLNWCDINRSCQKARKLIHTNKHDFKSASL